MAQTLWRLIFRILLVAPVSLLWLGFNLRRKDLLPLRGPAILVANHNSHLDLFALQSLFSIGTAPRLRPVAAADYFMRTPLRAWLSKRLLGAIGLPRSGISHSNGHPLAECQSALEAGDILILFPEGTRGEAEKMQGLKSGIAHLARANPTVPVIPVFMAGLGKALPRGAWVPIPIFADIYVGTALYGQADRAMFLSQLSVAFSNLRAEHGRSAYIDDITPTKGIS